MSDISRFMSSLLSAWEIVRDFDDDDTQEGLEWEKRHDLNFAPIKEAIPLYLLLVTIIVKMKVIC